MADRPVRAESLKLSKFFGEKFMKRGFAAVQDKEKANSG
jgi:hypothetical protein